MTAKLHHTPKEAFGNRVRETITLEGRDYLLDRPERLDLVFDHPQVRAAYDSDCYIPFWCDLWPASQMLAREILDEIQTEQLEGQITTREEGLELLAKLLPHH